MRRPKLSIRWMMIAVAFVSLAVGGAEYWRRAASYRALAAREAAMEAADRAVVRAMQADWARMRQAMERGTFLGPGTFAYDSSEAAESSADRHGRRRQAYRRWARYPWLSVEPEPE